MTEKRIPYFPKILNELTSFISNKDFIFSYTLAYDAQEGILLFQKETCNSLKLLLFKEETAMRVESFMLADRVELEEESHSLYDAAILEGVMLGLKKITII